MQTGLAAPTPRSTPKTRPTPTRAEDEDDGDGDDSDGDRDGDEKRSRRDDESSVDPADLEQEGEIAADYVEGLLDIADLDGDIDMDVEGNRAVVSVVGATLDELIAGAARCSRPCRS